ncbi:MAG: GNAT family N-acetyltransferase [Propionicimonas sp.]
MAKVAELTAAELVELSCPYCGRHLPAGTDWLDRAQSQWGRCGVRAVRGDHIEAVLAMTPGRKSGEALVKMLWVGPEAAGRGLGRQLVQAAAAEALRLGLSTVVAVGGHGSLTCATPPEGFLRGCGFRQTAGDSLWRLDLNQTVLERAGWGRLARMLGTLGHAGPQPAGGTASRRS